MGGSARVDDMNLPVQLSTGQVVRLGDLRGATLLVAATQPQTEEAQAALSMILDGYLAVTESRAPSAPDTERSDDGP